MTNYKQLSLAEIAIRLNQANDATDVLATVDALTSSDKTRLRTNRERVTALMGDGHWHSSNEICQPDIGGREGLRRLRELRKQGYTVEKRRVKDGGTFEYRTTTTTNNEAQ